MRSVHRHPIRTLSSAVPVFAGALAALAFVMAGAAYSIARGPEIGFVAAQDARIATAMPVAESASRMSGGDKSGEARSVGFSAESTGPVEPISPLADAIPAPAAPDPIAVAEIDTRPRLVLILDDVGLDREAADRASALSVPLTIAILPYAAAAPDIAQAVQAYGHDVMLHMPMEPLGLADPGPNALRVGLSGEDLQLRLRWGLARVPGAVGVNNHMGSRFTQHPGALRQALSAISSSDLIFVDSMTTAQSRGSAVAQGLGLRALERDVFLDHVIDADAIQARFADAEAIAQRQGHAIVIGHPHAVTLDLLETWTVDAAERGFRFVTVSTMATLAAGPDAVQTSALQ